MGPSLFDILIAALIASVLVVFGIWWYINKKKQEKYIKKVSEMSVDQRKMELMKIQTKMSKYKTSHVLHLLLSLFMLGFWIIPWIMIAQSNASNRRKLEKFMDIVVDAPASKLN
jgi:Mg2+/citrate symporter